MSIIRRAVTWTGGKKILEVRVPKIISPSVVSLPESKTGPLGIVEFKRTEPGALTPVSILPIKNLRYR